MNKFILVLLLSFSLLLLIACGSTLSTDTANEFSAGIVEEIPDSPEFETLNNQPDTQPELDTNVVNTTVNGSLPANTSVRTTTAMGNPDAPVTIVEYSDFQCPFCRRYALETFPQIKQDYIDTGRVYYVFKDFPIANLHPFAYRLHEAALCAADEREPNDFWQAHDLFFTEAEAFQQNSESSMDEAILTAFAESGLPDVGDCLQNGRFTDEVEKYIAEGSSLGVRGTPSFFINGTLFVGAQPLSAFEAAIQQAESGEQIAVAPPEPAPSQPQVPTPAAIEPRTQTALGDPNAPVTIIEYSDYQCPFCQRHVQETMPQLKENFIDTGRVYYVFKDFPIESLHPLAYRLHEAALCTAEIEGTDAYWQVHDIFFDQVERFQVDTVAAMDEAILATFADNGLSDVTTCLAEGQFSAEVQATVVEGAGFGINGTPTFFINGYPVSGAQPYELFEYAIGLAEEDRLAEAYQPEEQAPPPPEPPTQIEVPFGDAPRKGSPDAPITIVEYSDYQCPFCLRYFNETMPQIQPYIDDGTVQYVFKDFPLLNIHPQAQKAHEAAHCARELGGEGAYWVMHDLLFANQEAWASVSMPAHVEVIKGLASEANLPQDEFDTCLDNGRYADTVSSNVAEGIQFGITGTPTFFINGNRLVGAQPFSVFQQAIEQLRSTTE